MRDVLEYFATEHIVSLGVYHAFLVPFAALAAAGCAIHVHKAQTVFARGAALTIESRPKFCQLNSCGDLALPD